MRYTAKQLSYIEEFRSNFVSRNDYPTSLANWTLEQRETYNKTLAAYIGQNPQIFDTEQVQVADVVRSQSIREAAKFGFTDALSVFVSESTNQAQQLNPLSEANRTALWIVGGVAVVAASAVVAFKLTRTP